MIERRQGSPTPAERTVEFSDNTFLVEAALVGELLRISPARVPALMREGHIASACERGMEEHAGEFRLSFLYRNRRVRVSTDLTGLRRSVIDFGDRPIPDATRRAGA